jgi:hypothetical protein
MNHLSVFVSAFLLFAAQNAFATTVCHIPPDDPQNAHTISVSERAVPAHLNHGDCEGECPCRVEPCGDGTCDASIGESCGTCTQDCGTCVVCGNGSCDASVGESCETCEQDCGPCSTCGNGICDNGESDDDCAQDCGCGAPGQTCNSDDDAPAGCFCDDICFGHGDCCADACDVCGRCS